MLGKMLHVCFYCRIRIPYCFIQVESVCPSLLSLNDKTTLVKSNIRNILEYLHNTCLNTRLFFDSVKKCVDDYKIQNPTAGLGSKTLLLNNSFSLSPVLLSVYQVTKQTQE